MIMDILKLKTSVQLYEALVEAGIDSLKVLLTTSETNLQQITKLPREEISEIVQLAAEIVAASKFRKALYLSPWKRISTGCSTIDGIIRGGIPVNGITEIVGPSGVGKTQFCLQLSLRTQLPVEYGGQNKGVLYISTEDVFPSRRLNELVENLPEYLKSCGDINYKENIYLEHSTDFEQLRRCLYTRLPHFLAKVRIGLVIIDSIAGVFRSENLDVDYVKRTQEFHAIENILSELGSKYNVAIVCTNQVTDDPETGKFEPCLGLAWRNLLTCRFSLRRLETVREFSVDFAPDLPQRTCQFTIKENGLE